MDFGLYSGAECCHVIRVYSAGECTLDYYHVGVYIETIPNRSSPPAILLREGYRENGTTMVTGFSG